MCPVPKFWQSNRCCFKIFAVYIRVTAVPDLRFRYESSYFSVESPVTRLLTTLFAALFPRAFIVTAFALS